MLSVIVLVYVPAKAFAGMGNHQSVAKATAPMPDVAAALATTTGSQGCPLAAQVVGIATG
jgi:hypothetical protein